MLPSPHLPRCSWPPWGAEDWTPCFQREILDGYLPLLALAISVALLVTHELRSSRRSQRSAGAVAALDPAASSFTVRSRAASVPPPVRRSLPVRALQTLLPWNSQRLLPRRAAQPAAPAPASTLTQAQLLVWRTENQVIVNEVHRTPLIAATPEQAASDRRAEIAKRAVECVGSIVMVGLHAADAQHKGWAWTGLWAYVACISMASLTSKRSLFLHKGLLILAAFLVSLSELRSVVLAREPWRLAAVQCGMSLFLALPTLFAPMHTRLPLRLRAIHASMRPRDIFAEAGTAIPSPRLEAHDAAFAVPDESLGEAVHAAPGPSISHSAGGPEFSNATPALEPANVADIGSKVPLIPSPEVRASLYSRAAFGFVTPAIRRHYHEQFTLATVPDLAPADHAASVVAGFRAGSSKGGAQESEGVIEELAPSDGALHWRLIRHFLPLIISQQIFAAIGAFAVMTPPIGLRLILGFVADRDRKRAEGEEGGLSYHMAVLYVLAMAVGQLVASVMQSQALFVGRRICIRLRAILIFEIVNKSLRRKDTGSSSRKAAGQDDDDEVPSSDGKGDKAAAQGAGAAESRASDGEVTNLVSVDVFKVSEIGAYLHFLFPQSPIEVGFAMYLLVRLLGSSAVAGFAVLLFSVPLQTLTASLFVRVQKALLEATDKRLNLTTEVLNCIKTVKFFAWERAFEQRLNETRDAEMRVLRRRAIAWIINAISFFGTPMIVTLVTFAVHTKVLNRPLPAETAFTALALFNALRNPLDTLPDMVVNILSSLVSLRRIDAFLREEETHKYEQLLRPEDEDEDSELESESEGTQVESVHVGFKDARFTYSDDNDEIEAGSAFTLELDVRFPQGELSIICGPVGSGKTTTLLALLGEARQLSGRTYCPCPVARALVDVDPRTGLSETVAYCPQSPWLIGATVRENITFGSAFDDARYRAVLRACALEPDLKVLEYSDQTEVGERGTALSGGQKARIALARALYSHARYLLIDDALSAVDAHTAKHLYKHCLKGPLMAGRTVILVTHAVALCLPGAAFVVALNDGSVAASGTAAEVRASGVLDDDIAPGKETEETHEGTEEEPTIEVLDEGARAVEQAEMLKKQEKKAQHLNEETYGKGAVGFAPYGLYLRSFADSWWGLMLFWVATLAVFLGVRAADVGGAAWLRRWAMLFAQQSGERSHFDAAAVPHESVGHWRRGASLSTPLLVGPLQTWFNSAAPVSATPEPAGPSQLIFSVDSAPELPSGDLTAYYLSVYAVLILGFIFFSMLRDGISEFGALAASRRLYRRMMGSILLAPPLWFDRTPVGRIMNRLSKDIETIDQEVAPTLIFFVDVALQSVAILLVACYAVPAFVGASVLVIAAAYLIGSLYIVSSRDLKRLESVSRSPIFTAVGEVLNGAVVIRAFGDASRFTRHCLRLIDKTNRPFFFLWYCNRWLSIRVDSLATVVTMAMALFLVLSPAVDAPLAGFTLSFTIQLVEAVLWVLRMYTAAEIQANSVERIDEYLKITPERQGGVEPPAAWPTDSGSIVVNNLCVRYSPELSRVLDGVSFEVKAGQKIGIVGRTGSGKSTLALAFFRFLEAEEGSISIDGIDISSVPLSTLRDRLTVIPQDAQLFSGTVRSNLDPFNRCEDGELWSVLERCQLVSSSQSRAVSRAPSRSASPTPGDDDAPASTVITSLDMEIVQGGKNLSAGQRQLLALARGLLKLRQSPILLLDESTASLDAAADAAIQRTIRAEAAGRRLTILVIAHRLKTIIDHDRVLVLDKGKVLQFGTPAELLRTEGAFRELCERSGESELLEEMALKAERAVQ